MKQALTRAADRTKARATLQAAMDGRMADLQRLIQARAECGMDREDVDDLAILVDGASTPMFAMLNLHEPGKILNAPLYFAAFRGNELIVNYLVRNTPFCQDSLNAALYGASSAGSLTIVNRLLDLGADAACAEGACVEAAVAKGHDKVAEVLLAAGKSYTAALAAYIDQGKTDQVIDFLAEGADPLQALKAVCRQLSDVSSARDRRQDTAYKDAFDIILSYATGYGADIPVLLNDTMTYAIDRGAAAVIEKIIAHPGYEKTATQLDAALHFAAFSAFRGFNPVNREQYESLAEKLMNLGADPQIGLERAVEAGSVEVVSAALSHGADPRRNKRYAFQRAAKPEIFTLVRGAEQRLDLTDYAALKEVARDGLTVARLRETRDAGRTGLMIAAAAGAIEQALSAFEKEGVALTRDDLLARDDNGTSTIDLLCNHGQETVLLNRNLWLMREQEYQDVWQALPESSRAAHADKHAEALSGLKSHRDMVRLRQQAEEHRKRFRLK